MTQSMMSVIPNQLRFKRSTSMAQSMLSVNSNQLRFKRITTMAQSLLSVIPNQLQAQQQHKQTRGKIGTSKLN